MSAGLSQPRPDSDPNTQSFKPFGLSAHPAGLSTLFFTELWERFSYYGMRALLTLFMVAAIAEGGLALSPAEAGRIYGNYTMAVYMLAIPGGFIADRFLGARRAVLIGGTIIALGHYALAVPNLTGFYTGLILVALGTGLFKPNISALVGALYEAGDDRRDAGFALFYMGINIGAFIAPIITGFLAQSAAFKSFLASNGFDPAHSWHWGFAAAGVGMTIAVALFARRSRSMPDTLPEEHGLTRDELRDFSKTAMAVLVATLALMGLLTLSDLPGFEPVRWVFLALPVAGILYAARQSSDDAQRLAAIGLLFIGAMVFWAIFEQAGSTIALFADQLTNNTVAGMEIPSAWYQSLNPIFVILLTPIFAALWLSLGRRQPNAAIKFAIGLLCLAAAFLLMVPAATLAIDDRVSPLWLVGLFFLLTVGELFISPVGLSTMTKLSPARMTGLVLGVWFLATAFGNKLAGVLASSFDRTDPGAISDAFLNQSLVVAGAAVVMALAAPWFVRLTTAKQDDTRKS